MSTEALLGSVQASGCNFCSPRAPGGREVCRVALGVPDLMEHIEHKQVIDLGMFTF